MEQIFLAPTQGTLTSGSAQLGTGLSRFFSGVREAFNVSYSRLFLAQIAPFFFITLSATDFQMNSLSTLTWSSNIGSAF